MPIMGGKEACIKIRQLEKELNLTPCFLLIISGNRTESEISECLDQKGKIRAEAFLKKLVAIEDLYRVIASNLSSLH